MKTVYLAWALVAVVIVAGIWYTYRAPLNSPTPTPSISNSPRTMPTVKATIKTSLGNIEIDMDESKAPKTVANFVTLAQKNFYDNVIFHRVIPDFMIQGGDPTGTGMGGPGYQFEDEINDQPVIRGALAMANAGPGTNGSQFFIVIGAAFPHLDGKHTVFGQVTAGLDIVDKISHTPADTNDKPLTPVVIQDIVIQ